MTEQRLPAAYGGPAWSPRRSVARQEIGSVWSPCGVDCEWGRLGAVLLHSPGPELSASVDPDAVQMLAPVDPQRAREQHDDLVRAYGAAGVQVALVEPAASPPPNLLFVADLLFMTPEGAIVGRPASTVRAGEERWVARRLADIGIPILRTVCGSGTFEGADAFWARPDLVLLARGLRTNDEGVRQVVRTFEELEVEVVTVQLPPGTMHLMGTVRVLDQDLAVARENAAPEAAIRTLERLGMRVATVPEGPEVSRGQALNVVVLGPRRILMPAGAPGTRAFFRELGVHCVEVEIDELAKAAGGIACMTGVLRRSQV